MSEAPRRFRILSAIRSIQVIATGRGVDVKEELKERFGGHRWRKMKGVARIEKDDGWIGDAEIHRYEAHGVGKVLWKIKRQFGQ